MAANNPESGTRTDEYVTIGLFGDKVKFPPDVPEMQRAVDTINGGLYQKEALTRAWLSRYPFFITTPEGELSEKLPAGTYIAEDANGGFYPIAADVMEKTYRQVAGEGGRERNLHNYTSEELIRELMDRPNPNTPVDDIIANASDEMLRDELESRGWEVH